jgi:RNA polymerase sigma-70 factor (ECF subfamily)
MPQDAPSLDPDVALMLRVQQGDTRAFSELLERNHRRVLNLAYRYLRDRAGAEDVVQETFLKLYAARDRYTPSARFSSYLLRIASNVCLSKLRRKRPLSLAEDEEGRGGELPDPDAAAPSAEMLSDELKDRVRAAVERLPDRQRLAIVLNKFEGLDYKQVGEHLGLSPTATKSLLHRARMALKEQLSNYLEGGED